MRPCLCDKPDCFFCDRYRNNPGFRKHWDAIGNRPEPGLFQKAINLGKATWQHVTSGMKLVSEEMRQQRLTICKGCDRFDQQRLSCKECGCGMYVKAGWAEQKCPLGKWKE